MQIEKDMRYWQLAERKKRITLVLLAVALGGFLLLAGLVSWAPAWLGAPLWLNLNPGLLAVLLVFALCGLAAFLYVRVAEDDFDRVTAELQQDAWRLGGGR